MRGEKEIDMNHKTHLGIWQKKTDGTKEWFERSIGQFHHYSDWAKTQRIPPKSEKYRIALLGDSVAMGSFYEPELTPAKVLEMILNREQEHTEVIDLSCRTMDADRMLELCREAFVIKPDAIVIFVGKEFIKCAEDKKEEERAGLILRALNHFIEELNGIFREFHVKILFIAPEANVKDWRFPYYDQDSLIEDGKLGEWLKLYEKIKKCMALAAFKKALNLAYQLNALCTEHPIAYQLIASCYEHLDEPERSRQFYQKAYDWSLLQAESVPLSLTFIHDELLAQQCNYEISVVDLRSIIEEIYPDEILGKELFFDSYHMTIRGILIAMLGIARSLEEHPEELIAEFKDLEQHMDAWKVEGNQLPLVLGKAHLLAAIDLQQLGDQRKELIYYHCQQTLHYWPDATSLMTLYIEMISNKYPRFLHKNFTALAKINLWPVFPNGQQLNGTNSMQADLVHAMVAAMKDAAADYEEVESLEKAIQQIRIEGFGPMEGELNLLEPYYYDDNSYQNFLHSLVTMQSKCAFFIASNNSSVFSFYTDTNQDITISIVLKVPSGTKREQIQIILNDKYRKNIMINQRWNRYTIKVKKRYLNEDAYNTIEIRWPLSCFIKTDCCQNTQITAKRIYGYISQLRVITNQSSFREESRC